MRALLNFVLVFVTFSVQAQQCYKLVWSDEFTKSGRPDNTKWSYDIGHNNGWGNNELQTYTSLLENAEVVDGKLIIRAWHQNGNWTSARLTSKGKGDFLYGRFEINARLPEGRGTWPAIWVMPTDSEYGNWPGSGEIDIMEHVGYDPAEVHATVHTKAYNHVIGTQVGKQITVPDFSTGFHTYTLEWTPDSIHGFVDNRRYFSFANDHTQNSETWPFDKRFHLIINIAIGGNWGGTKGVDINLHNAVMEIDYVRVYSLTNVPAISGPAESIPGDIITLSLPDDYTVTYHWQLPEGCSFIGPSDKPVVKVKVGTQGGNIQCTIKPSCGDAYVVQHQLRISAQ